MVVIFRRSLDRLTDIFGLKGNWIVIFLVCIGASLFVALVVGFYAGSAYAIGTAMLLAVASFIACLSVQGKYPARRVDKIRAVRKIYRFVERRKSLCMLLRRDVIGHDEKKDVICVGP